MGEVPQYCQGLVGVVFVVIWLLNCIRHHMRGKRYHQLEIVQRHVQSLTQQRHRVDDVVVVDSTSIQQDRGRSTHLARRQNLGQRGTQPGGEPVAQAGAQRLTSIAQFTVSQRQLLFDVV